MKNKFYFNSKTQFENFGDAIISRELLKLASTKGEVHILAKNTPKDFLKIIDQESYIKHSNSLSFILNLLYSLFKEGHTYYLLNPGGFGGDLNIKDFIKQNIIIFIYSFLALCGVKLIRIGASMTNLSLKKGKLESKKSNYIYYNSYRDKLSMEIANSNSIRTNECFPDMAFLIEKKISNNFKKHKNIVLSFRDRKKSEIFEKISDNLININFFKEKSYQYQFLFTSQVDFDKNFNEKLKNIFVKNKFNAENIDFIEKSQYFNLYQNSELVISNRLHVLLFALVSGTRAIALIEPEHDEKIIGIFTDLGLTDLICDLNKLEVFDWSRANEMSIDIITARIDVQRKDIYKKFNSLIDQ